MFNLLLALIAGLIIGWNFHSFFLQLNPPNILKNDINISKSEPITEKAIPKAQVPKKIELVQPKETVIKRVTKEEKISTPKIKKIDTFYELLQNNLFSDAMSLYLDATGTRLSLYRATLLEYFKTKNQEDPHEAIIQMLEFQELEIASSKVNLELFHETEYTNDKEKAEILLNLINEKLNPSNEYSHELKLNKVGEHFTIDVTINNQPLTLLLDTGATLTMINEEKLSPNLKVLKENIIINTAGGEISAKLQETNNFSIEEIQLDKFQILSSTFEQKNADGLLGMNFFKRFKFKIDQEKAILYLSSKQ